MGLSRRTFLASGSAAATLAMAPRAFAQWQPSQRYPDPSVQIVDQSFARYRLALAKVERLATGFRWSEGLTIHVVASGVVAVIAFIAGRGFPF